MPALQASWSISDLRSAMPGHADLANIVANRALRRERFEADETSASPDILLAVEALVNTGERECIRGTCASRSPRRASPSRDQSSSLLDLLGLSVACLRELSGLIPTGLPSLTGVTEASWSGLN
jgi:hypothetical protein